MSRVGQTYSDYEILELLGRGGMGEVYRARQRNLDRQVAVKFISAEHYSDEINRRRFLREIKAASTLVHPNIVKLYDYGEREGDIFLVMEYLDGTPLETYIGKAPQGLPADFVLKVCEDVLAALAFMHPLGFIHRDIKPGNIMMTRFNRAVLMDFGLVKIVNESQLTQVGRMVGTPRYLPPEMLISGVSDHRGDVYQVGLVLCESVCGKLPFKQRELLDYMKGGRPDPPKTARDVRPDLDSNLLLLIQNALEIQPEQRYQDAAEMLADLANVRERRPIGSSRDASVGGFPRVFPGLKLSPTFRERYVFQSFVTSDPLVAVVAAVDRKKERKVHLKFLAPSLTEEKPRREALLKALDVLSKLDHPHVLTPTFVGHEDGAVYLAVPVPGQATLKTAFDLKSRFPADVVAQVGVQLAMGLAELHARGLVHGFLSPAMISIKPTGHVAIAEAELGAIARHTAFNERQDATSRITYYTAPEQLDGSQPTVQSDLYSLGVILYRMLTGELVELGADPIDQPNDALRSLLTRLVRKDPRRRPPDASWVVAEVRRRVPSAARVASVAPALVPAAERRTDADAVAAALRPGRAQAGQTRQVVLWVLGALVALSVLVAFSLLMSARRTVTVTGFVSMPEVDRSTLKWTTDKPVNTRIELGATEQSMELREDVGAKPRLDHSIVATGLRPGSTYHCRVLYDGGKSPTYQFRTKSFAHSLPKLRYRGLSVTISWETNLDAVCSVKWIQSPVAKTVLIQSKNPPARTHSTTLAGQGLVERSQVIIVSETPSGEKVPGEPVKIDGVGQRLARLEADLRALDLPGTISSWPHPGEPGGMRTLAVREKLDELLSKRAELFWDIGQGLPPLLDSPHVPLLSKAQAYKILASTSHLVEAARLALGSVPLGLEAKFGTTFDVSTRAHLDGVAEIRLRPPRLTTGDEEITFELPAQTSVASAEFHARLLDLPADRYVSVSLNGQIDLVLRPPQQDSVPGQAELYASIAPGLLQPRNRLIVGLRSIFAKALPSSPGGSAARPPTVEKLSLRYRRSEP